MASNRVQQLLELTEIYNSGDVESYLAALSPEFEFTPDPSFPDSDRLSGERLRAWMREWSETWEGNRLEVIEIEERSGAVLLRGRWHLSMSPDSVEVPNADFTLLAIWGEDEQLRKLYAFFDHERALAMLASETGP